MLPLPPRIPCFWGHFSNYSEFGVCPFHILSLPQARDPSDTESIAKGTGQVFDPKLIREHISESIRPRY